jgi:hypothetical protein
MLRPMRVTWIALTAILGMSLLGAYLLGRALEKAKPKPSLAPRGAHVLAVRPLSDDQRVISWRIGGHPEEPSSGLYGVTVVEGQTRLYTLRAPRYAQGIRVQTGDLSGDGRRDVLLFTDTDGSGGCGTYRAVVTGPGSARKVFLRFLCSDRGSIQLSRAGLLSRVGEQKDPKTRGLAHCCFLYVRTTVQRWNGRRLVVVRSRLRKAPS